jgi:amicoumacin kinase
LAGLKAYVYEYTKDKVDYILKITHTLRRDKDYLMGELEWMSFLFSHHVSLSEPVLSKCGKYIEELPSENGSFSCHVLCQSEGVERFKGNLEAV